MDNAISALLSVNFIFFALMIAGVTWVLKLVIEYLLKKYNLTESNFWRDVVLPALPVVYGFLIALVFTKYPYGMPDAYTSFRFVYGAAAGLLSSVVFRAVKAGVKAFIKSKSSQESGAESK